MNEFSFLKKIMILSIPTFFMVPVFVGILMLTFAGPSDASDSFVVNSLNIDPVVEQAYRQAAEDSPQECVIDVALIAAIGYVETRHGTYNGSTVDEEGSVVPKIIGIPLDGTNETMRIEDTDAGLLDEDTVYDRAVGPMQFIPSSWETYGEDGNSDDLIDPHNIFDAAYATVNHLCGEGEKDLVNSDTDIKQAVLGYNNSERYLGEVLKAKDTYSTTASGQNISFIADSEMVKVGIFTVHPQIADDLSALLQAAEEDGIILKGWGYRTGASQIALRKKHCGTSNYDIYQKPSSQCSPPTATPGSSQHEKGLAIDFSCNGRPIASSPSCFNWLLENAATYGLYNLKSEPWHWSVNGK